MPSQSLSVQFPADTMPFLRAIKAHNGKAWFEANRERYDAIKEAALGFVEAAGMELRKLSPAIVADARPLGGSLMRIHRDIRFAKDKSPYKTHLGLHFRHREAGEEHAAPGFFLHLGPGESGVYAGMWHPDAASLARIRDAIVADPGAWKKAKARLALEGESLQRVPRGYPADHPLAEDLRRKDFVAVAALSDKDVTAPDFVKRFAAACRTLAPLNAFLAKAVAAEW
ncbi:MAG: DUF2461 domain-containing protein [Halobacteriales archaeon]|nr:DUF2461 domain-containing protein [Halobacteriales archaeon]